MNSKKIDPKQEITNLKMSLTSQLEAFVHLMQLISCNKDQISKRKDLLNLSRKEKNHQRIKFFSHQIKSERVLEINPVDLFLH